MKYLSDYMEAHQTKLFKETGAFFAFSEKQFMEKRLPGEKYVALDGGLFCLKGQEQILADGLERIYRECIKQDIEENGLDGVILRELGNHECWYVGDWQDGYDALIDYPGITKERVKHLFYNNWPE